MSNELDLNLIKIRDGDQTIFIKFWIKCFTGSKSSDLQRS